MSRTFVGAATRLALAVAACASCSGGEASGGFAGFDRFMDVDAAASDEASGPEAGSIGDANGDVDLDWCAAQGGSHLLCEDFDQGVPGRLTSKIYGGATLAADVSDYTSAPESMWTLIPPLAGPHARAGAFAGASFMTAAAHVRLRADLQIADDCVGNADGVTLAMLTFDTYSVTLVAAQGVSNLVELVYAPDGGLASTASHALTSRMPNDTWTTIALEIDRSASRATVTLAGETVLSDQNLPLAPPSTPFASTTLSVGAEIQNQIGQSAGCRVRVDNVLFDGF